MKRIYTFIAALSLGYSLNAQDAFWTPTNYRGAFPVTDNTPVSLLESMSMNIPVITTGAGGIEYIIQDRKNGLITTGEPEDIAHKVIELMENENLYTTIQKSAADYVMMYNMPEVIRLWKELLTNNRS